MSTHIFAFDGHFAHLPLRQVSMNALTLEL